MLTKILGLLLLMGLVVLTGCHKLRLQSELDKSLAQQAASKQSLSRFDTNISALKENISQLETQIGKRNRDTVAYLKNHLLAVTCMAAVGYSVGEDNLFSDDVNKMINAGTFLCVAAAIVSEDFRNEVANVVGTLERASNEIKEFQDKLAAFRSKLAAELQARAGEQKRYDELSEKIRGLKAELAKL